MLQNASLHESTCRRAGNQQRSDYGRRRERRRWAVVRCLQEAGIEAKADVYHVNMHAFDMLRPDLPESVEAVRKFEEAFAFAARHYYAKID